MKPSRGSKEGPRRRSVRVASSSRRAGAKADPSGRQDPRPSKRPPGNRALRALVASVTVRLPAPLSDLTGGRAVLASAGATVGEVVRELTARYPALGSRLCDASGEPHPYVIFYLDDEDVRFQRGFSTPVAQGAELNVVRAIAGGR
jgi:sulfur-carrier protein